MFTVNVRPYTRRRCVNTSRKNDALRTQAFSSANRHGFNLQSQYGNSLTITATGSDSDMRVYATGGVDQNGAS